MTSLIKLHVLIHPNKMESPKEKIGVRKNCHLLEVVQAFLMVAQMPIYLIGEK